MILVSGGAGHMGSRLVKALVQDGKKVRVLTLPGDPFVSRLDGCDCEIAYGNVAEAETLDGLFDGVKTVYHLAAVIIAHDKGLYEKINVGGTRNMVEKAAAAGVEHFIHVSSAAAAHPQASDYALSKMKGEEIVVSQKTMHYSIVRPTLLYETGGGQEFMMFLDYLKKYPVVPFIGSGRAKKNPVYGEDVVRGMAAIADNPKTYGKIYNFSGGEDISIRDLARLMLRHQGISKPFVSIPLPLCRLAAFFMERFMKNPPLTRYAISRIEEDANIDNTAVREDLGYDPIGVTQGLNICYPL